jgi:hypothetical protein
MTKLQQLRQSVEKEENQFLSPTRNPFTGGNFAKKQPHYNIRTGQLEQRSMIGNNQTNMEGKQAMEKRKATKKRSSPVKNPALRKMTTTALSSIGVGPRIPGIARPESSPSQSM